jgi:tetratricopeptide (TPR) repeat protein
MSLADNLRELALAYRNAGDAASLARAEALAREALEMKRALCRPGDFDLAENQRLIGGILHDQGRLEEAEAALRAALETLIALWGEEHHEAQVTACMLGAVRRDAGDAAGAEALIRPAMDGIEATLGRGDWRWIECARELKQVLEAIGRPDDGCAAVVSVPQSP